MNQQAERPASSKWLGTVLWLQLSLILLAVFVYGVVWFRIKPLLAKEQQLQIEIKQLTEQRDALTRNVNQLTGAINDLPDTGQKVQDLKSKAKIASLSGRWQFNLKSDVSGNTHSGFVTLVVSGTSVTGTIDTFDRSLPEVSGNFDPSNNTLSLTRVTGLDTTQTYSLKMITERRFQGTFKNVGRYPDSGLIELAR